MPAAPGGARCADKVGDVGRAPYLIEHVALLELARNGRCIDRVAALMEREHGVEHRAMRAAVERVDAYHVGDLIHGVGREHQRA